MYAKKIFIWMLMATLTVGLSMSIASCKDDKDDDNQSEQRNDDADPLDTDEAETAWRWLCALTNAETLTSDWASRTYEPTIGQPSEQNANTRIVVVGDLNEARQNFASMVGADTDELNGEKTVSQSGVGKLMWTPSKENAENLAEVNVDIKIIPTLQKIVYCTEDQIGQNGLFTNIRGTAYYRLGDVVKDAEGFYWVCVRPAFEQNNKGDSHWINIINCSKEAGNLDFPEENLYDKYNQVTKYDLHTILLPTKLKYSREHMNNLTNLIWALLKPKAYAEKVGKEKTKNGLCGFDYRYHGEVFLGRVAQYWTNFSSSQNIWKLLFNRTYDQMKNELEQITLFYKGYQWRIGSTGYLWGYSAYKDTGFEMYPEGSESGDKTLYDFGGKGFDITSYCSSPTADDLIKGQPKQFGADGHYYWVVRYKKGDELDSRGKLSPKEAIQGCKDVYRYNEVRNDEVGSPLEDEWDLNQSESLEQPEVGCIVGSDGEFYANVSSAENCNVTPMALVVHYGKPGSVESGTQYRGLAISLHWTQQSTEECKWIKTTKYGCPIATDHYKTPAPTLLNGLNNSEILKDGCGTLKHSHPAADYCWNYNSNDSTLQKNGFSHWFLGSIGQWILAAKGMGATWDEAEGKFTNEKPTAIAKFFEKAGLENFTTDKAYGYTVRHEAIWTSSLDNDDDTYKVYVISFSDQGIVTIRKTDENNYLNRPMIAF